MTKPFIAVLAAFVVSVQPLSAQRGHASRPTAASTTHGPTTHGGRSGAHSTKPTAPTHTSKPTTTHPPKPTTSSQRPNTTGTTHGPKTTTSTHGSKPSKPTRVDKHKTTAAASTTATSTSSTGGTALTPVQRKLQKNTQLAAKLESRLPAGTDLMRASKGFKNLGQFVAAVNVSHNIGISFDQLKTSMVDEGSSLGQSIQTLKRSANADLEVQRAEREASTMISGAENTSTSTTTKTKKNTTIGATSSAPRQ